MPDRLAGLVERAGSPRILVVGDLILDRYVWGDVSRISPEGPIPVLRVVSEETRAGGAGNVVSNLLHLQSRAAVCGVVGDDAGGRTLTGILTGQGADPAGILPCPERPTSVKTRYMGFVQSARRAVQHMLRVDHETTRIIPPEVEDRAVAHLRAAVPRQQAVVVSDYDKGFLTERVLRAAIDAAQAARVPVVTDPKMERPYAVYRGSTVITPNRFETKVATGIAPEDDDSCRRAAARLREQVGARHVVITLDRDGLFVSGEGVEVLRIPVQPREVYDVNGAGDMVVSVLAFMLANGADIRDAAALANAAAGVEVTKLGAAPVSRSEIIGELLASRGVSAKVRTAEAAADLAREVRRRNGKVVWTNGCFDILHIGHYEYLRFARAQGDCLIVGLNSDESVRRLKGPNRPITGEAERARILSALDVVDCVVIFDEDTPLHAIEMVRPDVLVKGADYSKDQVVGRDFVESCGGQVVLAPVVEGVSTTNIVQRILEIHAGEARK